MFGLTTYADDAVAEIDRIESESGASQSGDDQIGHFVLRTGNTARVNADNGITRYGGTVIVKLEDHRTRSIGDEEGLTVVDTARPAALDGHMQAQIGRNPGLA